MNNVTCIGQNFSSTLTDNWTGASWTSFTGINSSTKAWFDSRIARTGMRATGGACGDITFPSGGLDLPFGRRILMVLDFEDPNVVLNFFDEGSFVTTGDMLTTEEDRKLIGTMVAK